MDTSVWIAVERGQLSPADLHAITGAAPVYMSPVNLAEIQMGVELNRIRNSGCEPSPHCDDCGASHSYGSMATPPKSSESSPPGCITTAAAISFEYRIYGWPPSPCIAGAALRP